MRIDKLKLKDWSEIAKNIVEILAFGIAGLWVLYTFVVKERPLLEPRTKAASDLVWADARKDICEAEVKVSLENISVTPINISKVRLRGWIFPRPTLNKGEVAKYLDFGKLPPDDQAFINNESNHGPFVGHYGFSSVWAHTFDFIVPRSSDTWILVRVDFYTDKDVTDPIDFTTSWGPTCEKPPKESGRLN